MSIITENSSVEQNYPEIKEKAARQVTDKLKELVRGFWAYTEQTGETDTKPFDGLL